jgi:hypothetical protein
MARHRHWRQFGGSNDQQRDFNRSLRAFLGSVIILINEDDPIIARAEFR